LLIDLTAQPGYLWAVDYLIGSGDCLSDCLVIFGVWIASIHRFPLYCPNVAHFQDL
jgi:hypothetical protein